MTPQDPLSQLRDIHLPETGGFWPPAPGWWLLALVVLGALAGLVWWLCRRRRRTLWLRQAKAELAILERQASPEPAWFNQLNGLLKRAARLRYPDQHPESLTGDAWIDFLLQTAPDHRIASRPTVEAMVHSSWQPSTNADPRHSVEFARRWLGGQA